jgi:hypothetical protein
MEMIAMLGGLGQVTGEDPQQPVTSTTYTPPPAPAENPLAKFAPAFAVGLVVGVLVGRASK